MNHLEVWELEQQSENGSAEERRWFRWIAKVEKLLGRELDGDEGDGLCLDWAHDAFKAGDTPEEYVASANCGRLSTLQIARRRVHAARLLCDPADTRPDCAPAVRLAPIAGL